MSHITYDTSCRLYNIGRTKRYGEEESDEDQDDETEEVPSSGGNINDSNVDFIELMDILRGKYSFLYFYQKLFFLFGKKYVTFQACLLYTSPSPRDS